MTDNDQSVCIGIKWKYMFNKKYKMLRIKDLGYSIIILQFFGSKLQHENTFEIFKIELRKTRTIVTMKEIYVIPCRS